MAKARRSTTDDELATLRGTPDAATVRQALGSKSALVVAAAAQHAKARGLDDLRDALEAQLPRFYEDPVKRDPGCRAKLALLEALDFLDSSNPSPFLVATRHVQLEPAWGPPVDTATGVRARGVLALARLGHEDLPLVAGRLLADPDVPVRTAAADALATSGNRGAAGALLLKLALPEEDPLVTLACSSALLTLAPDEALPLLEKKLAGEAAEREVAALSLGQSSRPEALAALLTALREAVRSKDREPLLKGLGLHRSDEALEALLEVVGAGHEADAVAAVRALAPRRFEPGAAQRVEQAVLAADSAELRRVYTTVFADPR